MFCHGGLMQITAPHLMIAAQAAARAKAPVQPQAKPTEAAGFEPLAFATTRQAAPAQGPILRPGTQVDITV